MHAPRLFGPVFVPPMDLAPLTSCESCCSIGRMRPLMVHTKLLRPPGLFLNLDSIGTRGTYNN